MWPPRSSPGSPPTSARGSSSATSVRDGWTPSVGIASPPALSAWLCYISTRDQVELGRGRTGSGRGRLHHRRRPLRARCAADRDVVLIWPALQARDPLRGACGRELRGRKLRPPESRSLGLSGNSLR